MSAKLVGIGVVLGGILYILLMGHYRASTHEIAGSKNILGEKVASVDQRGGSESILPPGLSSKEACFMLKQKYKIESGQSLGRQSRSVRHHWKLLDCGSLTMADYMDMMHSASSESAGGTSLLGRRQGELARDLHVVDEPKTKTQKLEASGTPDASSEKSTERECLRLMKTYKIKIGISWGSLPDSKQKLWTSLECDGVVKGKSQRKSGNTTAKGDADSGAGSVASGVSNTQKTAEKEFEKIEGDTSKKITKRTREKLLKGGLDIVEQGADGATGIDTTKPLQQKLGEALGAISDKVRSSIAASTGPAGLPSVTAESVEWCTTMKKRHNVIPMKSWGSLSESAIPEWKERRCDMVFTAARMSKKQITFCEEPNFDQSLPLISVLAASTTRKVNNPSTSKLALFTYMLPSLIRTIDCGYRYEYVLGYDKGDPFYDSDEGMAQVDAWFEAHIVAPLKKNNIIISIRKVKTNNTLRKPGPVFLEMARAAYNAGADYLYRVNDDTEMLGNWPKVFVKALDSVEPKKLAVVGPSCGQGNQKILTHDFVARQHMDIFEMNYYPPELTDWWMDDWISFVYGKTRTFKARQVKVIHHTGAHGQRYEVDRSHERKLSKLLSDGRKFIRNHLLKQSVDSRLLTIFDKDRFRAESFIHDGVPQ